MEFFLFFFVSISVFAGIQAPRETRTNRLNQAGKSPGGGVT
jgi:hypothetical protein